MSTRREFIIRSGAAGAALFVGFPSVLRARERIGETSASPLDILILGGTGFIGPHFVRYAAARGHRITVFTRGRHQAELPASVVYLQGDRNGQLQALEGKKWDVVVDDSGNVADWVRQSTALLKGSVGRYLFTSSTGVYYPYLKRGLDESDQIHYDAKDPKDPSETFGVMKAQGERYVLDAFGDRGIVIRPTYIVGPGDTSDRFPYWPVRLAKGGEVLAPGKKDDPVQFIDVRDLAEFMMLVLERGQDGIFNAAGPRNAYTAREFYEDARKVINPDAKYTFVDDYPFLKAHGIDEAIPWAYLAGNDDGMMSIRNDGAVKAGLGFRPLAETLRDTLAWWSTVPEARRNAPKFTIKPDMEVKALADWHALKG